MMSNEPSELENRIVLVLVGLVGSGKSTFAEALQQHLPQFRRCNQDELGDRRQVEALVRHSLSEGLSVCVDRTNIDARQRATWIQIAREFPGTLVWCIVFDTPYEACAQRLRERRHHPTIKTPEVAMSILARFHSQYQPPSSHEGFSRLLNLRPSDHPSPHYTQEEILDILRRIRDTPPLLSGPLDAFFMPSTSSDYRQCGAWRGSRGFQPRGYSGFRGAPGRGLSRGAQSSSFGPYGGIGHAQRGRPFGYTNDFRGRSDREENGLNSID